jgi:endoglucanase
MDSIGFVVRGIIDGFLQIDSVGRFDSRVLAGQTVTVHGRRDHTGVIVAPPGWCLPEEIASGVVPLGYLLVDLGLGPQEIRRTVEVGDFFSYDNPPQLLGDGLICGHSLDNRASLAALTVCLEALAATEFQWDIFVAATVQEETTYYGAHTAAQSIKPTAAIVVDVTYGRESSGPDSETFPLGGGPTNAWSAEVHPAVYAEIEAAAERAGVPLVREILPTDTGTEAGGILVAGGGVPVGVLSIPLRYMHSPIEVVDPSDIRQTGSILAELVMGLDDAFLQRVTQA